MKQINTLKAPKAIGPYSQAIKAGNYFFCSGQIGLDPTTNVLVAGGVEKETEQVLKNLQAILHAKGYELEDVVKTEIYLIDTNNFQKVNEVYAKFFDKSPRPARQTVGVASLPKNAAIEISCIAYRKTP